MIHASARLLPRLRLALLGLALAGLTLGHAWADDGWVDPGPAESTSDDMGDHMEGTENPDGMVTGSENPDSMVTGSDNPDSLVTGTQEMQNHEGRTYDASDLSEEAPDKGYESIMVPGQASWTPSSDPAVVVARRKLVRAQQRASAAMARYGQMMEDDFPRGAARLEITQERDDAMKALEAAKAELESVDGGVPANGW